MPDVTVKRLDEFDTAFGGAMKLVRHGLGVGSFGLQVIDIPPKVDQYPEHDHSADSQEEVYTALEGCAWLHVGGEEYELRPGTFARVGPGETRKIETKDESVRLIAIGGSVGKAYEISPFTVPADS
jgi:quercetin dioxygenase-like cupin family protein